LAIDLANCKIGFDGDPGRGRYDDWRLRSCLDHTKEEALKAALAGAQAALPAATATT
jgi:hypothetical protein